MEFRSGKNGEGDGVREHRCTCCVVRVGSKELARVLLNEYGTLLNKLRVLESWHVNVGEIFRYISNGARWILAARGRLRLRLVNHSFPPCLISWTEICPTQDVLGLVRLFNFLDKWREFQEQFWSQQTSDFQGSSASSVCQFFENRPNWFLIERSFRASKYLLSIASIQSRNAWAFFSIWISWWW